MNHLSQYYLQLSHSEVPPVTLSTYPVVPEYMYSLLIITASSNCLIHRSNSLSELETMAERYIGSCLSYEITNELSKSLVYEHINLSSSGLPEHLTKQAD